MPNPYDDEPFTDTQLAGGHCPTCGQALPDYGEW